MTTHEIVAEEVRAQFARRRLSGRRAALQLGWTGPYLSRRMTGDVPLDVNDLAAIAKLLNVPIGTFFPPGAGGNLTEYKTLATLRAAA